MVGKTMTMLEITQHIVAKATGRSAEVEEPKAREFLTKLGMSQKDIQITVPFDQAQAMIASADAADTLKRLEQSPLQLKLAVAVTRLRQKLGGKK